MTDRRDEWASRTTDTDGERILMRRSWYPDPITGKSTPWADEAVFHNWAVAERVCAVLNRHAIEEQQ